MSNAGNVDVMPKPPPPPPGAALISQFLDQIETCLRSIRADAQRLKEPDRDRAQTQ